jgi:hypothetical protein
MPVIYACDILNRHMRIILDLDDLVIERITDYWHANYLPSRAAAIRELLGMALDGEYPEDNPEPEKF